MKIRFYDIEDLNFDRKVDFKDYAKFAEKYGTSGHNANDNWAGGADFNKDTYVDAKDLAQFVEGWLLETSSVSGEPTSKLNPVIKGENPTGFQKYLRDYVINNKN
ncbi:MAG: hypothetical protein AABW67_05435 [Nanoarchaeota archaeon]